MKKIVRSGLGTVFILLLWAGGVFLATLTGWLHTPIANQNTTQSFMEAIDREIDRQFVGNFAMATLSNGVVDYEKFYSAGKPVDRHTVFQVASLSKWISAFGIMKLVEEGKLDLDRPVSTYLTRWQLPPTPFNNEAVTVRRLLSHMAGLTDGLGYSGFDPGTPVQSLEQSLTKAADADKGINGAVSVGLEPGSAFTYSGGGYTLLQLLVEEVSGQSFASYMKESVFEPLTMRQSTYVWDESSPDSLAEFYHSNGKKSTHYRFTALAATSLYTSLADLELFFQAHLPGKNNEPIGRNVVKPETIKLMRTPHVRTMGFAIWGLGTVLFAPTAGNDFIIGHDGKSTPPINTSTRLNPATGDGIIILETGNPVVATKLASEWVFWKTGQVDTFLFPMLQNGLVSTIAIGSLVIMLALFIVSRWRRLGMS
ncbi:serine hydrolase domain-containing protein [Spirosoma flavum]|uniref:Serine hydrolase domain-containing protein n=1 Tax=Spirosoma flavum TaxID=2048557 RepID=A0ABW6ALU8_9BACT